MKEIRKVALIIIIYLTGCVCSYQYQKFNVLNDTKEWTKGDRVLALCMSTASWCGVVSMGIVHGIDNLHNYNEPAEW